MNLITILNFLILTIISANGSNNDTQCPNAPLIPSDRRTDKKYFRLVQYNVEWLFIDQYKDCPGSSCTWSNDMEANIHMKWISDVLNDIDGDYINFCEIEGCDELNILKSLTNDNYNPYLIKGKDTATGQNVGVLSKIDPIVDLLRTEDRELYPINGSSCNYTSDSGTYGVSKHYYTLLNINNISIAIIGAHLIAYPTDKMRCSYREAQALVLQKIISELYINHEIIVIGDLNDYDGIVLDINSHKPKSRVLEILKGIYSPYNISYSLYPVSTFIEQKERYTEWYDANANCKQDKSDLSMIDHVLVSPNLYNKIINVLPYHLYSQYCNSYNSDHWPIIIDFKF
jgi:exonuclease III